MKLMDGWIILIDEVDGWIDLISVDRWMFQWWGKLTYTVYNMIAYVLCQRESHVLDVFYSTSITIYIVALTESQPI